MGQLPSSGPVSLLNKNPVKGYDDLTSYSLDTVSQVVLHGYLY